MITRFLSGWVRALVAPALLFAVSLNSTSCGSGKCLMQVCDVDGKNCRCKWHTCPKGSFFDTETSQCRCHPGYIELKGTCMTQVQADMYCGQGHEYKNDRCVATCSETERLDLKTGECIARQQISTIAQLLGIELGENETLGCPEGHDLVVEDASAGIISCVPTERNCPEDEVWENGECVKSTKCPIGKWFDPTTKQCTEIVTSQSSESTRHTNEQQPTFDLQEWTWWTYGKSGGDGKTSFCSRFNKQPSAFGVRAGSSITVLVTVDVVAPNNDPKQARVTTTSYVEQTKQPVSGQAANLISNAAVQEAIPLQNQTGQALQDAVQTTVRCRVVNAARPAPVPESGGL